jgi:hypothetical protein
LALRRLSGFFLSPWRIKDSGRVYFRRKGRNTA